MFSPEDFLTLAEELLRRDRREATLRTVISRAYYAVFLSLRRSLARSGTRHSELWREVGRIDHKSGLVGDRMRNLRNAADYEDPMPELEMDAAWCVERSGWLIRNFGNSQ